ncbi:hypothetical protein Asppvi_002516 [Aspergillus pseudoviridinutans]|uniref:Copper amine oxidase N2-terminal domain-containing protein n=1 Tax=Aspergillus pseudoviridinutans TaxID=1517512 RepID=A0A9P3B327_9EURO|nr:uncharacterized protein Asppvi_002516 [Aspergillus pseudoviridinutans]GIJ83686.1 hypothetical protein Asppvi_002516 [Aspergillus pseudoviridinutans]
MAMMPHPLDPLSPAEISLAVRHLNNAYPSDKLVFRVVTFLEPPTAQMIPYLEAERSGKRDVTAPKRSAFVQSYKNTTADFREVSRLGLATKPV